MINSFNDYVKRTDIPAKDLPLAKKIREWQEKVGKTNGYRRVHLWLHNIDVDPKAVLRVMQKHNLLSEIRSELQIYHT